MNLRQLTNSTSPIIGLSPMDGLTNEPFRRLQCQIAKPDVVFTEFVSAEGIAHGGVKLFDHLLYRPEERPIIGQIFGKDPDSFYTAAQILCHLGFDGIDVNMGCPAKTVTQHGSGAALIDKPQVASAIIKAVQSGVKDYFKNPKLPKTKEKIAKVIDRNNQYSGYKLPMTNDQLPVTISVKTRLGISQSQIAVWASHLLQHNLDFITIHGRTLKQGYSGLADWDQIKIAVDLAKGTSTKIWGNGDIHSRDQALERVDQYGVNGALIGRAALGNPWVFANTIPTPADRFHAMLTLAQLSTELFPDRRFDGLRAHFLYYASGLTHAKDLRTRLVHASGIQDLLDLEGDFV